ncbi:MAG: hypothetical protein D4R73_02755 [Deltaproteobacteria bacterium]|nr:MAG: hypothetical protein D4R73_02755 [Deltaproteobacteria bacterium]
MAEEMKKLTPRERAEKALEIVNLLPQEGYEDGEAWAVLELAASLAFKGWNPQLVSRSRSV